MTDALVRRRLLLAGAAGALAAGTALLWDYGRSASAGFEPPAEDEEAALEEEVAEETAD